MKSITKKLTSIEKKFVREAQAGGFTVGFCDNGEPYAMGAEKTGTLFSMEVEEAPEPNDQGSCYILKSTD